MNDKGQIFWIYALGESCDLLNRHSPLYFGLINVIKVQTGNQEGSFLIKHKLALFVADTGKYDFFLL